MPQPGTPAKGKREVGADYSGSAIGRWACKGVDFVVAKQGSKYLLHDLDHDVVASPLDNSAKTTLIFEIAGDGILRHYEVPLDVAQPAKVLTTVSGGGPSMQGMQNNGMGGMTSFEIRVKGSDIEIDQPCLPAPPVRLL